MELFIIKSQLWLMQWISTNWIPSQGIPKKVIPTQWISTNWIPRQFVSTQRASKKENLQSHCEESSSIESIDLLDKERGDVPGWVLVVLMTTGLVTAIWTIAAPRLSTILRNSLDAMNGIR